MTGFALMFYLVAFCLNWPILYTAWISRSTCCICPLWFTYTSFLLSFNDVFIKRENIVFFRKINQLKICYIERYSGMSIIKYIPIKRIKSLKQVSNIQRSLKKKKKTTKNENVLWYMTNMSIYLLKARLTPETICVNDSWTFFYSLVYFGRSSWRDTRCSGTERRIHSIHYRVRPCHNWTKPRHTLKNSTCCAPVLRSALRG